MDGVLVHVSVPHMRGPAKGWPRARVDFPMSTLWSIVCMWLAARVCGLPLSPHHATSSASVGRARVWTSPSPGLPPPPYSLPVNPFARASLQLTSDRLVIVRYLSS